MGNPSCSYHSRVGSSWTYFLETQVEWVIVGDKVFTRPDLMSKQAIIIWRNEL